MGTGFGWFQGKPRDSNHFEGPATPFSRRSGGVKRAQARHEPGTSRACFVQTWVEQCSVSPPNFGKLREDFPYCRWTKSCTTLKLWLKPFSCWHIQGNHHSKCRISSVHGRVTLKLQKQKEQKTKNKEEEKKKTTRSCFVV